MGKIRGVTSNCHEDVLSLNISDTNLFPLDDAQPAFCKKTTQPLPLFYSISTTSAVVSRWLFFVITKVSLLSELLIRCCGATIPSIVSAEKGNISQISYYCGT